MFNMLTKDSPYEGNLSVPLELKSGDVAEDGTFKGWGSTFGGSPDAYGDIVNHGAFKETIMAGGRNKNGIAMLYQHNPSEPIGVWTSLEELKKGLRVEGKLVMDVQKAREVHSLMKAGAMKGLSIGYDFPRLKDGRRDPESFEIVEKKGGRFVRYLKKLDLWEISPVTFPANVGANIITVKDFEACATERELEDVLREAGLSKCSSQYIVKLCRSSLRESEGLLEGGDEELNDAELLLQGLQERRNLPSDF